MPALMANAVAMARPSLGDGIDLHLGVDLRPGLLLNARDAMAGRRCWKRWAAASAIASTGR